MLREDRGWTPASLRPCGVCRGSALCVRLDLSNFRRTEGLSSGVSTEYRLANYPATLLTYGTCGAFCGRDGPVSAVYFVSHGMSVEASANVDCVSYNCLRFIGYFAEVWGLVWLGSCDLIYLQS